MTKLVQVMVLVCSLSSFAGDKEKQPPAPKPASVLPGCACSTGLTLTSVVVHNCTCPGDDGKPLQCVVVAGGVGVSVSCSR